MRARTLVPFAPPAHLLAAAQAMAGAPARHSVGGQLVGGQLVGAALNPALFSHLTSLGVHPAIASQAAQASAVPQASMPLQGTMPYTGASPSFAPSQPSQLRKWILGFGTTSVAANSQALIVSRPQTWFRPDRLVIPAAQAANFSLADIKIGNRSQFLNVNGAAPQIFAETATDSMVTFDTADPAVDITVVVNNITGGAASITPTMIGASAY